MLVGVSLANGNPRHPIRGIARLESLAGTKYYCSFGQGRASFSLRLLIPYSLLYRKRDPEDAHPYEKPPF